MTDLPFSPAAERNQQPILDVLRRVLPAHGSALEIAAGTGQHTAFFAAAMARWTWQPTDAENSSLPVIAQYVRQANLANVRPPRRLDVMAPAWPAEGPAFTEPFDAIYCANMLHIAPWPTCAALMQGSARHLAPSGVLVTYGPYLEDGVPTSLGQSCLRRKPAPARPGLGHSPVAKMSKKKPPRQACNCASATRCRPTTCCWCGCAGTECY